jgi:YQGE family putative transporter
MHRRLSPHARVVLGLNALYNIADALCSVFVGVYFYVNSRDFDTVCHHYLALYTVTPFVFVLAGWYSQARDRLHVFRLGLLLHAAYYALLLVLRERSAEYPVTLGALLGVTWGLFWAGNNVFSFDVTTKEERDYYFGWLSAVTGAARMFAPLLGGLVIYFSPGGLLGYQLVFAMAVFFYLAAILLSSRIPADSTPRPFHLRRALFPGRDQRDWQRIMIASASLMGSINILSFLLGLILYMETRSEMNVGSFAAVQALAGIAVSYVIGRTVRPGTRNRAMLWSALLILAAGVMVTLELNLVTLVLFGLLQAVAAPLFGVPHSSLRFDVIDRCAEEPGQRIEYLCAWEVPLAVGRTVMMLLLIWLVQWEAQTGLKVALFVMCAMRIVTYLVLRPIPAQLAVRA